MRRITSWCTAVVLVLVGVLVAAPTAYAQGAAVGGWGGRYFLNDAFTGIANRVVDYGDAGDETYFGDWDGNGTDTPLVRRGNTFFLRNSLTSGIADVQFSFGNPGDEVLVGDWDGNGTDTLSVRRGSVVYVRNTLTSGYAERQFTYGDPGDVILVGDWDGNGADSLAIRRLGRYFVRNSLTSGPADHFFGFGNESDIVLAGDWDGNGTTTLAVRRGIRYFLRNSTTTGGADVVFDYGNPSDRTFAGDWNGDGRDTLGTRRPPVQPTAWTGWRGVDWETLPTSQRVVALTFDGGSSDVGVPRILATLRRHGVDATFFVTGDFARRYPQAVQAMAGDGHPVGNHSNTHPEFTKLSDAGMRAELAAADASIAPLVGQPTRPLFRYPYGDRSAATTAVVNGAGYIPFRWTVDSLGWQGTSGGRTAAFVCQRVLSTARPGQVVLLHVGAHPTDGSVLDADALPCIIEGLRARGYAFGDLRDMVA